MGFIFEGIIVAAILGLIGGLIGKSKGRTGDGIILGALLGLIGCLITAMLKNLKPTCPECGGKIIDGARKCKNCGSDLFKPCPHCQKSISWTAHNCPDCGDLNPNWTNPPKVKPTPVLLIILLTIFGGLILSILFGLINRIVVLSSMN